MSDSVTIQALTRLSHIPDSDNPAELIAGQTYDNVEFVGGSISNVTLTDVTINGSETARTETVITGTGNYTVQIDDYVITINKTIPEVTTIILPASPTTSRSIIVKDGQGEAADFNITIDPNGKTIDSASSLVLEVNWGSYEIIYNGTEWNVIGSYKDATEGDVVGPPVSTDNAIARFDGLTGKVLQNTSQVTITDSGVLTSSVLTGTAPLSVSSTTRVSNLNVATSGVADTVSLGDGAGDNLLFPMMAADATGNKQALTHSELSYNATTNTLTTDIFNGDLTGTATTATTTTNITVANQASDTTCFPIFVTSATGDLSPKTNANLTFNSSTGAFGSSSYLIGSANALSFPSSDSTAGASIAIGTSALVGQTTSAAYNNVAIGYQAMDAVMTTAAINNTAVGNGAGGAITQGSANTLIGYNAGSSQTTGIQNVAVGTSTSTGSTGSRNIAVGTAATVANNATTDAVMVGASSSANTQSVSIGRLAGSSATNATGNATYLGYAAGRYVGSGLQNTFVGAFSGTGVSGSLVTASGNTGLGYNSLSGVITTAANNTALGTNSGLLISTGTKNTILGANVASTTLTTGSNNIIIGVDNSATTALSSTSNTMLIKGTGTAVMSATNLDTTPVITLGGGTTVSGTLALGSNSLTMTGSIASTGSRVTKVWATDIESTNAPTVGGVAITARTNGTAQATTSGTAINFTGIPSTAKQVTVSFSGVSTNNTNNWLLQIGPVGGIETSSYASSSSIIASSTPATSSSTSGFVINSQLSTNTLSGSIILTLVDSSTNRWAATGVLSNDAAAVTFTVAGAKALAGALERVRLTTVGGADTFDAGQMNIQYQ